MTIKKEEGNTQASSCTDTLQANNHQPVSQPLPALSPDNLLPVEPDCDKHSHVTCALVDKDPLLIPSDVSGLGGKGPHWAAMLFIHTRDVPRMMREGFHWSPANLCREHGTITPEISIPGPMGRQQKASMRSYFLADLSDELWWSADLEVVARPYDIEVLSRFKLSDLSPS